MPHFEIRAQLRRVVEDSVQTQRGEKSRIEAESVAPQVRFVRIQRVVGHDDRADSGQAKNVREMVFRLLFSEELPNGIERWRCSGQAECMQYGDDPAGCFRERRVVEEEGPPDSIRALD